MQRRYAEPDYAFGQLMLTLRLRIGLTQASLARILGVTRQALGGWEAGRSYPKTNHLKHFITLALEHQVFSNGKEAEEIRALWRAAHQKVLLDERWLQDVLSLQTQAVPAASRLPDTDWATLVDWGDVLDAGAFYGREEELALLSRWLVEERCRTVSVLGLGGIGKSALVATAMRQVVQHFEVVIWRSVRDAPTCEAVLDDILHVLAPSHCAKCLTHWMHACAC